MRSPAPALSLTDAQARQLEAWLASRQTPASVALRCRIVLLAAQGMANAHIAERLGITRPTVLLWRKRFMEGGPQALLGETLAGAGPRVARPTARRVLQVLEGANAEGGPWTVRQVAEATGLSPATVHRAWRHHGIKPHLVTGFPLVKDRGFAETFQDIVAAYVHPPYHALLLASHPKAPGSAPNAPIPPRGDFFLLMRSLHALRLNEGLNTHTPGQFLHFLEATQGLAKPGETLHLVVDTWQALRDVRVEAHLEGRPELRIGQLEEDCAWKDLMRWWFQPLVAQRLAQGALPSFPDLEQALALFLRRGDPDPFQWIADRIHYL